MRNILAFTLFVALLAGCGDTSERSTVERGMAPRSDERLSASSEASASGGPRVRAGELLIKLTPSARARAAQHPQPHQTGLASLDRLNQRFSVRGFERVVRPGRSSRATAPLFAWYKVSLPQATGKRALTAGDPELAELERLAHQYRGSPDVEAVEPNYEVSVNLTPDDPYYASSGSWGQTYADLWGIRKIDSAAAWELTTGSASIVVADIDTGVDRNHPDIADNMWVNAGEIPGDGLDNDGNGYVDDHHGWDWVSDDNDPMDDHGHGTHTVGTIAATGDNGLGVVGVNWTARIMALKFLSASGSGSLDDGMKALQYAADMGARISSNSWGCACQSAAMDDAVRYEHERGMVVVTAAGNSNADALTFSPASADRAITVAASDPNDLKASFSNWGEKIDVAAPGVEVLSLKSAVSPMCTSARTVGVRYCRVSGTSMATPHVAGLAALLLSYDPALTNEEVRQILRASAADLGAPGKDPSFGYGRILASAALSRAGAPVLAPIITSPRSRTTLAGPVLEVLGGVPGTGFVRYTLEVGTGRVPTAWIPLHTSNTQVTNGKLAELDPALLPDGSNILRLTAFDTAGRSYQFQIHDFLVDNLEAVISSPVQLMSQGVLDVRGTARTKNGVVLSDYDLEWGVGTAPTSWSRAGLTLVGGGTQPVLDGVLATWDTRGLVDGQQYTLRLTVRSAAGGIEQATTTVTVDKGLVPNWPKALNAASCTVGSYWVCRSNPAVVDLDGDGTREVVLSEGIHQLGVYRRDGTALPGFPVTVPLPTGALSGWFGHPPAIADLDGDGTKEIVASLIYRINTSGGGDQWVTTRQQLVIIRSDGSFQSGWPKPSFSAPGDQAPAIADLDGDSTPEILIMDPLSEGTATSWLHAYRLDGSELPGFPRSLPLPSSNGGYGGSLTVADLDGDGSVEVAFGFADRLYLLDRTGQILPGWPVATTTCTGSSPRLFLGTPAVGDLDGDGTRELFALGSTRYTSSCPSQIHALRKDGSAVPGWPLDAGLLDYSNVYDRSPSVADLDGDGRVEVLVGMRTLKIFGASGLQLDTARPSATSPAISDVTGDGRFDYTFALKEQIGVADGEGGVAWSRSVGTYGYFLTGPAFADLDGNGKMELSAVATSTASTRIAPPTMLAFLWEMPSASPASGWPMFMHDPAHTGNLGVPGIPPPPDTTPPVVSIGSPVSGATVRGIITVSGASSDNRAVTKVEIAIDSGPFSLCTGTTSWSYGLDTRSVGNGARSLHARATDSSGNTRITTVTVNVDNDLNPPTVSITSPAQGATVSGVITVSGTASDDAAVAKVELQLDSGPLLPVNGTTSWSWSLDTNTIPNGAHTLTVWATDSSGNKTSSSRSVTVVDSTMPVISIGSPSNGTTVSGPFTISGTASDAKGLTRVEIKVDNGPYVLASGTSAWSYTVDPRSLTDGTHTLTARATDSSQNMATVSVSVVVKIAPTVTIHSPVQGSTVSGHVDVSATATDNQAVSRMELYIDGVLRASSSGGSIAYRWNTRNDTGSRTLLVRAFDPAGNVGSATSVVTVQ